MRLIPALPPITTTVCPTSWDSRMVALLERRSLASRSPSIDGNTGRARRLRASRIVGSGERSTQAAEDRVRIAHHPFDHLARWTDIVHQSDALPHEPRHLFPVGFGVRRGQERIEFPQLH